MTLSAGSKAPKAVRFTIRTGDVDGTTVASVRVRAKNPVTGVEQTWGPMTPSSSSPTQVVCTYVLAGDGSSVPDEGFYECAAWLYDSGGALLDVTKKDHLLVGPGLDLSPPT